MEVDRDTDSGGRQPWGYDMITFIVLLEQSKILTTTTVQVLLHLLYCLSHLVTLFARVF